MSDRRDMLGRVPAESRRFKVLSGVAKTFPHEKFGQVNIFVPSRFRER